MTASHGAGFAVRPEFDVTPETTPGGPPLGVVLDRDRADVGTLSVPLGSLNRHTFVCGATGAGKSQTVRGLLGYPHLVRMADGTAAKSARPAVPASPRALVPPGP